MAQAVDPNWPLIQTKTKIAHRQVSLTTTKDGKTVLLSWGEADTLGIGGSGLPVAHAWLAHRDRLPSELSFGVFCEGAVYCSFTLSTSGRYCGLLTHGGLYFHMNLPADCREF
jgi:hypothetical protein